MPFANHRLLADKLAERLVLAVAGVGELAGACCFCGAARVSGGGFGQVSGGMLFFCKTAPVCGGGFGQTSEGMLLLQSSACLRLQLWARKPGHASFAKRRLLAVAAGGGTDPESSSV